MIAFDGSHMTINDATINYSGAAPIALNAGDAVDTLNVTGGTVSRFPPIPSAACRRSIGGGAGAASLSNFAADIAPGVQQSINSDSLTSLSVASNGAVSFGSGQQRPDRRPHGAHDQFPEHHRQRPRSILTSQLPGRPLCRQFQSHEHDPRVCVRLGQVTSSLLDSVHAIGYADGADHVVSGLASGDILLRFTYKGDVGLDGAVNFRDMVILSQHYGSTGTTWDSGDLNGDGSTGFADLVTLAAV